MRIVFMGATELGWECCRLMLDMGQNVVGIFTIPQQFRISWSPNPLPNVRYKSFEDIATKYNLPVTVVTGKMSDPKYREILEELAPDIVIVIGWYYIIPRQLRELAPLGVIGIHASLLPKYRGASPLVWALINGEAEAGISLFYLEDGIDTGNIVAQERFSIGWDDDIQMVIGKSTQSSLAMIREYIPKLADGTAPSIPQNNADATYVSPRTPDDGYISWQNHSACSAYNWIRAQTHPYPGAFTLYNGQRLALWRASLTNQASPLAAGSILLSTTDKAFGVVCSDQSILNIFEISTETNETMTGAEWYEIQRNTDSPMSFT
ncbi:MAG: methionyl-tRNA formyltransferase [Anaerolineae bacterium]|nr:methionyl-tRNA formyltransferase [Anaerolineae bacterium]